MSFRFACGAMASAILVTLAPAALAQDWPNRSIVAVSTVSAGNAADTVARIVLDQVSKQIGQSFVIENRTGAGGTIGSASAAKAGRAVRLAAERAGRRTVERLDVRHRAGGRRQG
jgi:tripartite-type tricarboxylate transporter receptor subunit TctC